ncbi:MAG: hypothetical protein U0996_25555 [Planctomycetaceae bacterium]
MECSSSYGKTQAGGQASIGRKEVLEQGRLKIEADQLQLDQDKGNIPKQLQNETDPDKKKSLREQRGALRGRGKDLDVRLKDNTKRQERNKRHGTKKQEAQGVHHTESGHSAYLLHQQGISGLGTC